MVCSAGNVLAKHGEREVQAKARSLAHASSVLLKVTLDPKHLAVAWLAHWAAMTINHARERETPDGRIVWRRRYGNITYVGAVCGTVGQGSER